MIRTVTVILLVAALAASALGADTLKLDRWDKFTIDTELMRNGQPTFAWPDGAKNTSVVCYNVPNRDNVPDGEAAGPADLTKYNVFRFWVHCQEPKESIVNIIFRSENPESKGIDYYSTRFTTDFTGWKKFQWFLPEIGAARKPMGWDQVSQILFSSNWSRKFDPETTLHFQDIEFVHLVVPGIDKVQGEILSNRSFELLAKNSPVGWGLADFGSDSKAVVDDKVVHSGEHSVRIDGTAKGRAGASASFRGAQADPSKKYVFSAWVKIESAITHSTGACARFTSVQKPKKVLKSDIKKCEKGPHDWKKYEWEVELPEGTDFVNLVLFHHGEGKVWWDDVSLKQSDK